jgi:hypothetical protein
VRVGGWGPAVVLLHGYGETGDMWVPLAKDLAREGRLSEEAFLRDFAGDLLEAKVPYQLFASHRCKSPAPVPLKSSQIGTYLRGDSGNRSVTIITLHLAAPRSCRGAISIA